MPSPATAQSWGRPTPRRLPPGPSAPISLASVTENAVHGSDAAETAAAEIAFFFPEGICERVR